MSIRSTTQGPVAEHLVSLDEALEQTVLALESNESIDREQLLEKYPQWANDLNQFIDNWVAMEQRTSSLAENPRDDSVADELNGQVIGDYELLQQIAAGGMGVVYRARQISLGRIVALKMVLNAVRDQTRFRIEAEAAASLHHAHIVAIHEIGEYQGQPFLSMQYLPGGNLHDYLQAGPMPPRKAAVLVRTIANAVHYAHQRGVLHRDLKPANVLLDAERRPYVSDFGLAKQIGNSIELTRSGAIIGTPGYMAPEQAMGQVKSITVAADVYGLGAILYAALTGEPPFKSDSDLLTLRKVIEDQPISPRVKRPQVDRNLDTICLKCLEKSPAARYGSAKHLADDLTRYLQGEPVHARPVGFIERRWRWCVRNPGMAFTSFIAGLMLIFLVLLSLGFVWREYLARMNSRFAIVREAALAEAIELARVDADSKNKEAVEAVSDLYTNNGLWAARTDLLGEALLWFARAASLNGVSDAYIQDNKTRCLSWLSRVPKPIAALQLPTPLKAATFRADSTLWQHSPALPEVMFKLDDEFGIWNYSTDEIWRPSTKEFVVSSARWNHDGSHLILCSRTGELRLLDATTKATKAVTNLDGPISSVSISTTGKKIIVSTSNKLSMIKVPSLSLERSWDVQVGCVATSISNRDDKVIVVTEDSQVSVYDVTVDAPTKTMQLPCFLWPKNPFAPAFIPKFSEDGTKLFLRDQEGRFRVLDTTTGKQLGPFVFTGSTNCLAMSPNQSHFASGGDGYARVQTINWKDEIPAFARHDSRLTHGDAVTNIAFGGVQLIATAGRDRLVQLWNVGEKELPGGLLNERAIPLASLNHTSDVRGLLFADTGDHLVTVQGDGLIRVWQIPSFDSPGYLARGTQGGSIVKGVSPDTWLIAGATHWGSNVINASLRRLKDGLVLAETPLTGLTERGHLLDSAVTADQSNLVSLHAGPKRSSDTMISSDGTAGSIQVWALPDGIPLGTPLSLSAEPRSVAIHPDGKFAAVLLVTMDVALVDLASPRITAILKGSEKPELDFETGLKPMNLHNGQVAFSQDGAYLYCWGIGEGFAVWDWQQGRHKYSTDFAAEWHVRHLAISKSGKQLVLADDRSNRLVIVDDVDGKILHQHNHLAKIRSVEYSPSGEKILTACEDGRARIIDACRADSKPVDLVHNKQVLDARFSPDGLSVATLTSEMRVFVWRMRDRQWAMHPMNVPKGTRALQFSSDSQCLITMGLGRDIRVLNLSAFDGNTEVDLKYVTNLGELLSAKSIEEGGIVDLTTAQWLDRWRTFKSDWGN